TFFFQAEDGIRDATVTGVQTCALPIFIRRVRWVQSSEGEFAEQDESLIFTDVINRGIELAAQRQGFNLLLSSVDVDDHDLSGRRSEERRVGKEGETRVQT